MRGKNIRLVSEQKGFTILEILIAISILTVGLLAVATMQVSAIRGNKLSDDLTIALALSEDKMERLQNIPYNDPDLADTVTGNNANLSSITSVDHEELNIDETGSAGGKFRRIWNIADSTPIINNKTVTILVTWDNNKHKVSISSIRRYK